MTQLAVGRHCSSEPRAQKGLVRVNSAASVQTYPRRSPRSVTEDRVPAAAHGARRHDVMVKSLIHRRRQTRYGDYRCRKSDRAGRDYVCWAT